MQVGAPMAAPQVSRIRQQVHVLASQSQSFPDPQAAGEQNAQQKAITRRPRGIDDALGLFEGQCGRRLLDLRDLQYAGPDPSVLPILATLVTTRRVAQETGLDQPIGHILRNTARCGAGTQELADRGEVRVHSLTCGRLLAAAYRGLLKTELVPGQFTQGHGPPVGSPAAAPVQIPADSRQVVPLGVGRSPTRPKVQRKVTGFLVDLMGLVVDQYQGQGARAR